MKETNLRKKTILLYNNNKNKETNISDHLTIFKDGQIKINKDIL